MLNEFKLTVVEEIGVVLRLRIGLADFDDTSSLHLGVVHNKNDPANPNSVFDLVATSQCLGTNIVELLLNLGEDLVGRHDEMLLVHNPRYLEQIETTI